MAQLVECSPHMFKALNSIPSTTSYTRPRITLLWSPHSESTNALTKREDFCFLSMSSGGYRNKEGKKQREGGANHKRKKVRLWQRGQLPSFGCQRPRWWESGVGAHCSPWHSCEEQQAPRTEEHLNHRAEVETFKNKFPKYTHAKQRGAFCKPMCFQGLS